MRVLILSGGTLAGAWQAGVLQRLIVDEKRDFDYMVGVSVGAIATAILAQSKKDTGEIIDYCEDYIGIWENMKSSDDMFKKRMFPFLQFMCRRSLFNNNNLRKTIHREINTQHIIESERIVRVGAVEMESGLYKTFGPIGDDGRINTKFHDAIIASTSMPIIFPSVTIGKKSYIDGGIRNNTPFNEVSDMVYDMDEEIEFIVIQCSTLSINELQSKQVNSNLERIKRYLQIMINEIFSNDLSLSIEAIKARRSEKQVQALIYRPLSPPVPDSMFATQNELRAAITQGYHEAERPLLTIG